MPNTVYENFVLSNVVEDQFNSHLMENLNGRLTQIHIYKRADGIVSMGQFRRFRGEIWFDKVNIQLTVLLIL